MIINSLDKSQNIQPNLALTNKVSLPKAQSSAKKVGMKDMVFYRPLKTKIAFGANRPEKATSFEDGLAKYCPSNFKLDRGQRDAMASLHIGDDTLFTAPTGSGKTLVAKYIIAKNLSEDKGTAYATPTKALANEKYEQFCKDFGKENVGLHTGDVKINPDALVQVQTQEIYLNKLLDTPHNIANKTKNLATFVCDEIHTINDRERGMVYEMSVIKTPAHVQILGLSATASNDSQFTDWLNRVLITKKSAAGIKSPRQATLIHVSPEERHVPTKYFVYSPKSNKSVALLVEKYSLGKIKEAHSSDTLSDKQKEVLEDISKRAGGDGSHGHGVEALSSLLQGQEDGKVGRMEEVLTKKLGMEILDAKRTAALLSDRSQRSLNTLGITDVEKAPKTPPAMIKKELISPAMLKEMMDKKSVSVEVFAALQKLDGNPRHGYQRVVEMTEGKDVSSKEFRGMLAGRGIKPNDINMITKGLTAEVMVPHNQSPAIPMVVKALSEDKGPVMCVSFSKKGCDELKEEFLDGGHNLLTEEEREQVKKIIKDYKKKGVFLGTKDETAGFLRGVAVHHSGKMPGHKSLVEELASKKLIKAVFSTDTLGVGIDFPVRTVAFAQLSKYAGLGENGDPEVRTISANEFHQIGGRAGRRLKDAIGNNILMTDEDHSIEDIFKLATSPADNLVSNFRPSYQVVANLVDVTKGTQNIGAVVDDSFLRESINPAEQNADEVVADMKNQFNKAAKVVTDPSLGCFTGEEGGFAKTLKGALVEKARGVNGILFAHMMTDMPLDTLSHDQLAAVACALTEGNPKNITLPGSVDEATTEFVENLGQVKAKLSAAEIAVDINPKLEEPNLYAAQFVQKWAQQPEEKSKEAWETIVSVDMKKAKSFDEGDLFKSVNRTADVIKQIGDAAGYIVANPAKFPEAGKLEQKMRKLSQTAKEAYMSLKKYPIEDVSFLNEIKHVK